MMFEELSTPPVIEQKSPFGLIVGRYAGREVEVQGSAVYVGLVTSSWKVGG